MYYFESGILASTREGDTHYRSGLGRYLSAADAPSLSCQVPWRKSYRLIWIEPYRPAMIVQVTSTGEDWELTAWRFAHPRTRQPLAVESTSRLALSATDVTALLKAIEDAQLWQAPVYRPASEGAIVSVIEGQRGPAYRALVRSGPFSEAWKQAGRAFMAAAGVDAAEFTGLD